MLMQLNSGQGTFYVSGIVWNSFVNGKWAYACTFKDDSFDAVRSPGADCARRCYESPACTHFAWDGAWCYFKKGKALLSNAELAASSNLVCGIIYRYIY